MNIEEREPFVSSGVWCSVNGNVSKSGWVDVRHFGGGVSITLPVAQYSVAMTAAEASELANALRRAVRQRLKALEAKR